MYFFQSIMFKSVYVFFELSLKIPNLFYNPQKKQRLEEKTVTGTSPPLLLCINH